MDTSATVSCQARTAHRWRALANLLHMGHCAPAVMQTLQEIRGRQSERLVAMTAGLPGGIGNTGFECGGVTAALIQLGLDHGLAADRDGLPEIVAAGHEYCQRFESCNRSLRCQEILGARRVPLPCIRVVCRAPELYHATAQGRADAIPDEARAAFRLLYSHLSGSGFHCAHAVLGRLGHAIPTTQELRDATSGFMGGTVFQGWSCSAFVAGVMAVGLKLAEIEDSLPRVIRMLATMIAGGNALADDLNEFNRIVNIGGRMAEWFSGEFGSTSCGQITQCDFATAGGVHRFIESGSIEKCRTIARRVAEQVEETLALSEPPLWATRARSRTKPREK